MPKRTLDQSLYWSQINRIIGQRLRAYYRACTTEELPPRLLAAVNEEIEPRAKLLTRDEARRIAANIAKLPDLFRAPGRSS